MEEKAQKRNQTPPKVGVPTLLECSGVYSKRMGWPFFCKRCIQSMKAGKLKALSKKDVIKRAKIFQFNRDSIWDKADKTYPMVERIIKEQKDDTQKGYRMWVHSKPWSVMMS